MQRPSISVLMPVYNAEKYVAEAVESILNQTFSNFEFLIIDDGSSDGSLAILKHYAQNDRRIHLVSRPNTGLVVALNEMLGKAKGEFIARMDADDIAMPERFVCQVEFLEHHPNVVGIGCSREVIDEKGRLLLSIDEPEDNNRIQQLMLAGICSICHPSAMIRRKSLLEVGGYDESLELAEDLDLWLKLGEVGALANLRDKLLKYRLHQNSVSERKHIEQRSKTQIACERAWQRRSIEGRFEWTERSRPGTDCPSQYRFTVMYGWWAFNIGQRKTALIYGLKAIATLPFMVEGWRLLACAVIKPLPKTNSK